MADEAPPFEGKRELKRLSAFSKVMAVILVKDIFHPRYFR
jgi:hypothetical protein